MVVSKTIDVGSIPSVCAKTRGKSKTDNGYYYVINLASCGKFHKSYVMT